VVGNVTQYDIEKEILLSISELTDIDFDSLDDETIDEVSPLLDKMSKSVVFDKYFEGIVETITDSLTSVGITSDNGEELSEIISSVNNWSNELKLINSLKNISEASDVTSELFTKIENSEILGGCKYNVLISMIKTINESLEEESKLSIPTVGSLSQVVGDETQYDIEKRIILNLSKLENINFDQMDGDDVSDVAPVLDDMSMSVIFNKKYNELVKSIKDGVTNSDYGVATSNQNITDWEEELTILINIKDGMSALEELNKDNLDASVIGSLLTNMDNSLLIDDTSSQNVANKIVTDLTKGTPLEVSSISKEGTWTDTFSTLIESLEQYQNQTGGN